jgi:putative tryptophan/tyrosine transport system substrate-binding protein
MSYGVNYPDLYRRAATFVDKILKGTKPSDRPAGRAADQVRDDRQSQDRQVAWPRLPPAILLRADEVIE